jgi:hypothetical protein
MTLSVFSSRSDKDSNPTFSSATSSTSIPSLLDFSASDAEQMQSHESPPAPITVETVTSEKQQADPMTGQPIGPGTVDARGVLTSGQKGLGPEGQRALDEIKSAQAAGVVGEAKGENPEVLVGSTGAGEKSPWFKKVLKAVKKGDHSKDDASSIQEDDGIESRPSMDDNRSVYSAPEPAVVGGPMGDRLSVAPTAGLKAPSVTTEASMKDKVLEEIGDAEPTTSGSKFHKLFPAIPADEELIEGSSLSGAFGFPILTCRYGGQTTCVHFSERSSSKVVYICRKLISPSAQTSSVCGSISLLVHSYT